MDKKRFGKKLAQLRTDRGFSQSELAAALGLTNKSISKWETGTSLPGIETLADVAVLFELSLPALIAALEGDNDHVRVLGLAGTAAKTAIAASVIRDHLERMGWHVASACEFGAPKPEALTYPNLGERSLAVLFASELAAENAAIEWIRAQGGDAPGAVIAESPLPLFETLLGKDAFTRASLANGLSPEELATRYAGIISCGDTNAAKRQAMSLLLGSSAACCETKARNFLVRRPQLEPLRQRANAVIDTENIVFLQARQNDKHGVIERERRGTTRFFYFRQSKENAHDLAEEQISAHERETLLTFADQMLSPVSRTTLNIAHDNHVLALRFYDCYPFSAVLDADMPAGSQPELPPYLTLVREITASNSFTPLRIAFDLAHGRL